MILKQKSASNFPSWFFLFPLVLFTNSCNEEKPLTLIHDGLIREYYVSFPVETNESSPLIINMHGHKSNALEQRGYSEMDEYALPRNIAVVYPEGIKKAWNVGTDWEKSDADDIGFINALIDSVAGNYNIDLDRVYACGMSNGGYMAYELACALSRRIAAFGSVTGNFMMNPGQECKPAREIPIIHIHGTSDSIVPYTHPTDSSMTVVESIEFWKQYNDLTLESVESLPDLITSDKTTVEKVTFSKINSKTQFVHFKVNGGGHQWFGSKVADRMIIKWVLGNNNHDINASKELIDFFLQYRLSDFNTTAMVYQQ